MLKNLKVMGILVLALMMVGCAEYRPRAPRALGSYTAAANAELSGNWLSSYDALPYDTPAALLAKQQARNQLISAFIWAVDRNYDRFEVQFYSNKATEDIAGDFIGIALGSATVFTASAHAKTILATVAAAVVGTKASVDAHWYNTQTRESVVSEMRALRATQLTVIETGMTNPVSAYSLDQGILDVQAYYQDGSIVSALQAIAQMTSSNAVAAKATLLQRRLQR